ncbi:N-acetylglucosamine-6-phosphate deacetylase [Thermanaerothrix sp. 4228-RoL]|uniref:N-acetylglucosamine-6-phosphate deacetylase n=1 Tax=Thermanaerothrix solaris TaxID=3058434 RepID=A0ABU3NMP5_9CHLR|nr:N-acetylglucosamine-6-phosphate deacetylase [Thermanaerothrix sp. 4228-RoL]MDT8898125.1 N-acetylglucosamine-6-phosphate deacetylase [Thermanaerothrix sp. 4228-RoL]
MLLIDNATLYTPTQCYKPGRLLIAEGRILAVGTPEQVSAPAGTPVLDAQDLIVTPGWLELQINGGFGFDFTENPTTIWEVARQLPRYGVTAFLPTIVTSPLSQVEAALETWKAGPPPDFRGATPLGWHIEGPFLNPGRKGAHNPAYLQLPNPSTVEGWRPDQGVRLVTLAPELPGAEAVIHYLVSQGVRVSAGHSLATYEQALHAFSLGVTYGTHLFNAMPPLEHRAPGLAGALLTHPDLTVGLIADGIHVHPAMVALAWRAKGPHRLTLVTDAMAALGMPPGEYRLGDLEVRVDATSVRLPDGTLAGSLLSLDTAMRNLMAFSGCTLAEALCTVTSTPAAVLGLEDRGYLRPGYRADLVLLSVTHEVVITLIGGEPVFGNEKVAERLQRMGRG